MRRLLRRLSVSAVITALVFGVSFGFPSLTPSAYAFGTIGERSVELENNVPGQTSEYTLALTIPAVATLGSIKLEFCENSPLYTEPCDAPGGFNLAGATLVSQSGDSGFSIDPSSTANMLILSRTPGPSSGNPSSYILQSVTNANVEGTQYARYSTYAADDASGVSLDEGAVAYTLNGGLGVGTEVPPYLEFCVATAVNGSDCNDIEGNYLNLGDFASNRATTGQLQMAIATNAANGYMVSIDGQTMASGGNALPPLSVPSSSGPGTNQFGINLRANSNPTSGADPIGPGSGSPTARYNGINKFAFQKGDVLASSVNPDDYRKYTVTYLVNIRNDQPAGVYAGTYTYVGMGNF